MARKRMLSPEVFTSRTVTAWPVPTRWTWIGLLCYLDDYGYGDDSAALLKASAWPLDDYTPEQVADDLARFVEAGSVCRFTCCDKPQIHAPKWTEWQTVQHPSKQPRFCVCPRHSRHAHETHMTVSRTHHETLSLIEVNSSEENLSDSGEGLANFHRLKGSLRGATG